MLIHLHKTAIFIVIESDLLTVLKNFRVSISKDNERRLTIMETKISRWISDVQRHVLPEDTCDDMWLHSSRKKAYNGRK